MVKMDNAITDRPAIAEARRVMEVCNACRYCEGFCAVFPAMEQRRDFLTADLDYLANLCHNCKGCYHACQYAPPHEFGINVPATLGELRTETYGEYAWPRVFSRVFARSGTLLAVAIAGGLAIVLLLLAALEPVSSWTSPVSGAGAFYRIIPWDVMAGVAGLTVLLAALAMVLSGAAFWRVTGGGRVSLSAVTRGLHDILTLKNLGGGGDGCNDFDEAFSQTRRRFHHALFYGFLLCFASTCTAAFEAYVFQLPAPYPYFSVPVLLGLVGGLGMVVGATGLFCVKLISSPLPGWRASLGGDYAFILQLLLVAASGLALLAFRGTAAMGTLLALHLGLVLSLFLTMPYSKFVHGLYRGLALIRSAMDRNRHVQNEGA